MLYTQTLVMQVFTKEFPSSFDLVLQVSFFALRMQTLHNCSPIAHLESIVQVLDNPIVAASYVVSQADGPMYVCAADGKLFAYCLEP